MNPWFVNKKNGFGAEFKYEAGTVERMKRWSSVWLAGWMGKRSWIANYCWVVYRHLLGYDAHALSSQISEGSTKKERKSGNGNWRCLKRACHNKWGSDPMKKIVLRNDCECKGSYLWDHYLTYPSFSWFFGVMKKTVSQLAYGCWRVFFWIEEERGKGVIGKGRRENGEKAFVVVKWGMNESELWGRLAGV